MHKVARALLHLPVGIVNGVLCIVPIAAFIFFLGFMLYEINEDFHLKDCAYLDIFGYLIGFPAGFALVYSLGF